MQRKGIMRVIDSQHARCRGGGVGQRCIAFQDDDLRPAAVKFESERQTDDAGSGYKDV